MVQKKPLIEGQHIRSMRSSSKVAEVILTVALFTYAMDQRIVGPSPRIIADLFLLGAIIALAVTWLHSSCSQRIERFHYSLKYEKVLIVAILLIANLPRSIENLESAFRSTFVLLAAFALSVGLRLPTIAKTFSAAVVPAFLVHIACNMITASPWADPGAVITRPTNTQFAFLLAIDVVLRVERLRNARNRVLKRPERQRSARLALNSLIAVCFALYISFSGSTTVTVALIGALFLALSSRLLERDGRNTRALLFAYGPCVSMLLIAFPVHLAVVNVPNYPQPASRQEQPAAVLEEQLPQKEQVAVTSAARSIRTLDWRLARWQETARLVSSNPWSILIGVGNGASNQHNAVFQLVFGGGFVAIISSLYVVWNIVRRRKLCLKAEHLPVVALTCIYWLAWSPTFITMFLFGANLLNPETSEDAEPISQ